MFSVFVLKLTQIHISAVNRAAAALLSTFRTLYDHNTVGVRSFETDGSRGAYKFISYTEAGERVSNIASGLVKLGLKKVRNKNYIRVVAYVLF